MKFELNEKEIVKICGALQADIREAKKLKEDLEETVKSDNDHNYDYYIKEYEKSIKDSEELIMKLLKW